MHRRWALTNRWLSVVLLIIPIFVQAGELPVFTDPEVNSFVQAYAQFVDEYVQACQAAKTGDTARFIQLQKEVDSLEKQVGQLTEKLKSRPDEARKYEQVIAGYTQKMIDASKQ